ncbi:hypothetical protein NC652_036903 [Populus alba x Populus x berolinensis]|nr:hypothetical protein NC652_036903 [Populus alba x Populus x berolinensis]
MFEMECFSSEKDVEGKPEINHVTVFERPGLKEFLKQIGEFADLILFTAGIEGYASPLFDRIDVENRFSQRLFRPSTVSTIDWQNGVFSKVSAVTLLVTETSWNLGLDEMELGMRILSNSRARSEMPLERNLTCHCLPLARLWESDVILLDSEAYRLKTSLANVDDLSHCVNHREYRELVKDLSCLSKTHPCKRMLGLYFTRGSTCLNGFKCMAFLLLL